MQINVRYINNCRIEIKGAFPEIVRDKVLLRREMIKRKRKYTPLTAPLPNKV